MEDSSLLMLIASGLTGSEIPTYLPTVPTPVLHNVTPCHTSIYAKSILKQSKTLNNCIKGGRVVNGACFLSDFFAAWNCPEASYGSRLPKAIRLQ